MFSELEKIIFPDRCEILEIVPSQRYIFPIFKNGSSSLREYQPNTNWKTIVNEEIGKINGTITVFLRDPKQRFISGVNTFVQHLLRTQQLDVPTVLYFVKNYLFLNRHYCPQFFWLVNLARYNSNPLNFESYNGISELTPLRSRAGVSPPTEELLSILESFDWKTLELYFFLDQILLDRIGQTLTFESLINDIKVQHPELYDLIFSKAITLTNVLSKT